MSFGENRKIHGKHKFLVDSDKFGFAAFQKMSELSVEAAKIEYWEGGAIIPIKDLGRLTFSDVTLERGTSADFDFHNWFLEAADATKGRGGNGLVSPLYKTDVFGVSQLDRNDDILFEWTFIGASPMKYVAGDWDNTVDEVVIEQIVVTYDYFLTPDAPLQLVTSLFA